MAIADYVQSQSARLHHVTNVLPHSHELIGAEVSAALAADWPGWAGWAAVKVRAVVGHGRLGHE